MGSINRAGGLQKHFRFFSVSVCILDVAEMIKVIFVCERLGVYRAFLDAGPALDADAVDQRGVGGVNGPHRANPGTKSATEARSRSCGLHLSYVEWFTFGVFGLEMPAIRERHAVRSRLRQIIVLKLFRCHLRISSSHLLPNAPLFQALASASSKST